jgi:hypothetical protein
MPLVKRPIEEIIAVARDAGRKAFVTRETVEAAFMDARFQWIGTAFPKGEGVPDDQFDDIVEKACDAFEAGVEDYLAESEAMADTIGRLEREVVDEQFDKGCAAEILYWAASIFQAIKKAAQALPAGCNGEHIVQLAGCGDYLTTDRADLIGYTSETNAEVSHE